MISKKYKNVGVLGRGKWGMRAISILKKIANVKFVYGKDFKFKNIDKDIQWVFIMTPNATHYHLVKLFLEKNYNVFCEKPLSLSYKKSLKLYNLAIIQNKKLYVDDVEIFKKKKIKINRENIIVRKKKDKGNLRSLIDRLFYHDAYLLAEKLNYKKIKRIRVFKNKTLNIEFYCNSKRFKFIYDINSKKKEHRINNANFLKFTGNPLRKMFKSFLYQNLNLSKNKNRSLFAQKLLEKIKKKI